MTEHTSPSTVAPSTVASTLTAPLTGTAVPDLPRVEATFEETTDGDTTVTIAMLGTERRFEPPRDSAADHVPGRAGDQARTNALAYVQQVAASPQFGRPVRVHTRVHTRVRSDDTSDTAGDNAVDEVVRLIVTPDGTYYDETNPHDVHHLPDVPDDQNPPSLPELRADLAAAAGSEAPAEAHRPRTSFIRTQQNARPAELGWRGALNRVGLQLAPGPAESAVRDDITSVRQHWAGPRTVAVANPKGSANKTPTTAMLGAVFARYGGAGVLAWDNNETRGSLAWRTERAAHEATVLDLIPNTSHLLSDIAQSAELTGYTHHQPADKYDVLASDQSVAGDHEVSAVDVERLHRVATRYYRLILMDSGNNERAMNWRTMMGHAHTLVVPCTNVEDTAEAGALMLEALTCRDEHSAQLARNAVAVVSQRVPGKDANMARIIEGLRPLVRDVATIPFDPALVSGVIHFDALRPATQRAWLRAAAAVAGSLA